MMGSRQGAQDALFYEFSLEDHVPADHLIRSERSKGRIPPRRHSPKPAETRKARRAGPPTNVKEGFGSKKPKSNALRSPTFSTESGQTCPSLHSLNMIQCPLPVLASGLPQSSGTGLMDDTVCIAAQRS